MKKLLVVLLLGWATSALGHTGDTYFAQRLTAMVDGDLSEWAPESFVSAGYYSEDLVKPDDDADFSATYAVGWDDRFVYLAAKIYDDLHVNKLDIFRQDGDYVSFTFDAEHKRYPWGQSRTVSLALSSVDGTISADPDSLVNCRIVRDDENGVTIYEASVKITDDVRRGSVNGFRFAARENDGFRDGTLLSSPPSHTLPSPGFGDLVWMGKGDERATLGGTVMGSVGDGTTYVHAFDGDRLVGSDIAGADGQFTLQVRRADVTLMAVQGHRASRHVTADKGPNPVSLKLDRDLGSISGRVTKPNGLTPVPFANVVALQDGKVRARVFTDHSGGYTISGLDSGIFDVVCHVAFRDTLRGVTVEEGKSVDIRPFRATDATFNRPVLSDEVFAAFRQAYAYNRNQPFDVEVIESRTIDAHTRETLIYSSVRGERVEAYVAVPNEGEGPFPCLITLHSGSITGKERADFELIRRRMTRTGYVVAAIDAKGFNVRRVPRGSGWWGNDRTIQTVVDYRRLIDYLSTRTDVDSTRIGIYGGSMGVRHGTFLAGVDDRIKAFVMRGPGLSDDRWTEAVDINDRVQYVPRFPERLPIILFAGYYDWPWAVQGTVRLVDLIEHPVEMVWYHTTHTVSPKLYMDRMEAWVKEKL